MVLNGEMTVEEAVALMTNFEPPIYYPMFETVAAYSGEENHASIAEYKDELKQATINEVKQMAMLAREMYMLALYRHISALLASNRQGLSRGAKNTGVQKVTLESLVEWARDEYGVGWTKFNAHIKDEENKEASTHDKSIENLSAVSGLDERVTTKKLYVILGYLIELIAQLDPDIKKKSSGGINDSAVSQKINNMMIKEFNDEEIPRGYGDTTIRKIIKAALDEKNTFVPSPK